MIYILSHADSDGRFASYCAWLYHKHLFRKEKELLDTVKFFEVQYGKPFPLKLDELTKEDTVYILDFSYHPSILDPVFSAVGKLQVLDHHESAEEYLKGTPYAFFDMTKSGALLAWEYFFPDEPVPLACQLVNDRDLWQWKMEPYTSAFEAWLHYDQVKQDWEKWHLLSTSNKAMDEALEKGKLLHEHNLSILRSFTSNPDNYRIVQAVLPQQPRNHLKTVKYAIYNGNQVMISELAQEFYTTMGLDGTIDWRCRGDRITFSVRSPNPEKFSAKDFCKSHGGGGHPKASAFSLPLVEAFAYIEQLMTGTAPY